METPKNDRTIPNFTPKKESQNPVQKIKVIESEDFEQYGITPKGERVSGLKIYLPNNNIAVMLYRSITSPIFFAGYKIVVRFGGGESIEIIGDNLEPILDYIVESRLVWIKAAAEGEEQHRSSKPKVSIEAITFKRDS